MKILIERSGRSFFLHAVHWAVFGLYVYQTIDQSLTTGQFLTSLNCAIWVAIAYVRFVQLQTSEAKLDMLENEMAHQIVSGFEQFMKDNKEALVEDLKGNKAVKIKLKEKDERAI
jgi:hypothetical protein